MKPFILVGLMKPHLMTHGHSDGSVLGQLSIVGLEETIELRKNMALDSR